MKQLGAYEAKTHLSRLLDEVEGGESYAITKHGRPVALLVPIASNRAGRGVTDAIDGLRRFRVGRRAIGRILPLAHSLGLSVYDAAYLDLASRQGLPLATADEQLARASQAAGFELFEAR